MSLQERQGGNVVFLTISQGKLVRRVDESTPGAVSRTNKVGKVVHELFYTSLIGHVKDVTTKETEYGKFWVVKMQSQANDQVYQIDINYASGYAFSFLKALPNVDLSQNVELSPALIKDGEYTNSVIFLKQGGVPVKHFFTKANPNGMPERERIKVKGKETSDNTNQMEFLEKYLKNHVFSVQF